MDLLIQPSSRGIRYDGYDTDFIECIYEDSDVSGQNERYEFRCRPNLGCCGRLCCIPEENLIPLWLMILYLILGLLFLLALIGTICWFLRKIAKERMALDSAKRTKIAGKRPAVNYSSFKQKEFQNGADTEKLIRKEKDDLYSTPNDAETTRFTRGKRGYRNPLYTTTTSTVKIRETFDRTIDDGSLYGKTGIGTETGTGTGGETTGRSETTTADSDGRKQLNTSGIRRDGYQTVEATTSIPRIASTTHSIPVSSEHYSTRETFEERCEENYVTEEDKSISHSETKELL